MKYLGSAGSLTSSGYLGRQLCSIQVGMPCLSVVSCEVPPPAVPVVEADASAAALVGRPRRELWLAPHRALGWATVT